MWRYYTPVDVGNLWIYRIDNVMDKVDKHCMLDKQYNIKFDHPEYGETTLSYGKNPLNGCWMYWSDIEESMYASNKHNINVMVKNIRLKHPESFEYIL